MKEFRKIINQEKPVLVDFFADWCGPCKVLSPIVDKIKENNDEKIEVLKLNVAYNSSISDKYTIFSVPTLILFKNGKIKWRATGVRSERDIQKAIDKALR